MPLFSRKKDLCVVMIHGYGRRTSHEFDDLAAFLKKHKYPVVVFDLYDVNDPEDADASQWVSRAETVLEDALKTYKNVALLGFSMGGVIASSLASRYPVKMLILVAPAFSYLDFSKVANAGRDAVKNRIRPQEKVPSAAQQHAFTEVVDTWKESIASVTCPILILHGTEDEVIPPRSSRRAYEKIPHPRKRLLYLEGAHHRVLYDGQMEMTAFQLILDMLEGKLIS